MNPNVKFMRFLFMLLLALSALGISTSTALADQPALGEFPFGATYTITDLCSFDLDVIVNAYVHSTDFYDHNGTLTRTKWHVDEQDTFTANGKTLIGMPFTFNIEWSYDSNGNWMDFYADGVVEKVPLPDGSLFISAGQIDWMTHLDTMVVLTADKGNPGNIAGFCAALAP